MTKDYAGKDFITDGIGEVSNVVRYVDGDTTVFKLANGKEVTIRYNGVNTPESTYRIEPWGYAASRYNKKLFADALAKGAKIVLEAEPNSDRVDTIGTRYLAWIWLVFPNGDSRLVNLELAELGYGLVKNASPSKSAIIWICVFEFLFIFYLINTFWCVYEFLFYFDKHFLECIFS